jgi:cytochrome c
MFKAARAMLASAILTGAGVSTALSSETSLEEMGRKQFIRCSSCHSMSAEGQSRTGPHLEGIVGRPVASVSDFVYSDALRAQDFVWDEAQLEKWLVRPQELVPGMCMPFMGLPRPEIREALIAYLKNPAP